MFWASKKISHKDIIFFCQHLAILLEAGINIIDCFSLIRTNTQKVTLQKLIISIEQRVLTGLTLASSIQPHSAYFTPFIQQLIFIGEQSGKLELMLTRICEHLESMSQTKDKLMRILFYPCFLSAFAFLTIIILLLFIVPRFEDLFNNTANELPFITSLIFFCSLLLRNHTWILLITMLIVIILFFIPSIRLSILKCITILFFHIPFLQRLQTHFRMIHFSEQLACTYNAGIPITEGLKMITDTQPHADFRKTLIRLQHQMQRGWPMHIAMLGLNDFPDSAQQMVRIGEESGKLEVMLNKIMVINQTEADKMLLNLTQWLEPLIILILGVLIGGLVVGMYLPLFKLGNTF